MSLPTVALLVETSRAYGRGLCQGISEFAHAHGEWNFVLQERDIRGGIPNWLNAWKGDGIICRLSDPGLAELLANSHYPVVDIYGQARHPKIPFLDTDANAVAQMAIRFLLDAAFDRFAFCGFPGLWFSDEREAAFVSGLKRLGFETDYYRAREVGCSTDVAAREARNPQGSKELEAWVKSLPPRTAILACNDVRAQQLLTVALRSGRKVPEDLAVIGVDDDELICDLTNPRLTSIRPDTRGLGYTAAHWLNLMMRGLPAPARSLLIPPLSICERASTDVVASDDPSFVKAVRFIRSNVNRGIDVRSVVTHMGCSRSTLEGKFRSQLGRTVKDEIIRVKVKNACILLRETKMSMEQIASSCGFATASHFSRIFKGEQNISPGRYRVSMDEHDPPNPPDEALRI